MAVARPNHSRIHIRQALLVVIFFSAVIGWSITLVAFTTNWLLVFGATCTLLLSAAYGRLSGRHSLLDPLYLSTFVFSVLFIIRPAYDIYTGNIQWVYIDITDVYTTVLLGALLAGIGYFAGILSRVGPALIIKLPSPSDRTDNGRLLTFGFMLFGAGVSIRLVAAAAAGGISTLFTRRETFAGEGTNLAIFVEGSMIVVPALLIFLHSRCWAPLLSWIGISGCTAFALLSTISGDRRYALTLVCSAAAFHFVRGGGRPSIFKIALGALAIYLLMISPVELTRGTNLTYLEAVQESVESPTVVAQQLFLQSQSTSMLSAFGLVVQTLESQNGLKLRYGLSTITESILQPIPRQLWKSKPASIRTIVIQDRWGFANGRCVSLCPTFSSLAPFYSDFGLLGVLIGSFLLGIIVRIPFSYYERYSSNFFAQAAFASMFLLPLFIWWGSIASVTIGIGTSLVPLAVASWFSTPVQLGSSQRIFPQFFENPPEERTNCR